MTIWVVKTMAPLARTVSRLQNGNDTPRHPSTGQKVFWGLFANRPKRGNLEGWEDLMTIEALDASSLGRQLVQLLEEGRAFVRRTKRNPSILGNQNKSNHFAGTW